MNGDRSIVVIVTIIAC